MKALVTGGAGFIGSNLALELEKQGHKVIVADRMSTGTKNNLDGFKGKILKTDISKPFEIKEKLDAIFHIAAITDPRFKDDNEMIKQNLEGFRLMIELAKKNNAKLAYASSASLYGNGQTPMKEDQKKELLSAYAKSKLMMDEMAEKLADNMHIVGLRYFNVYGPREAHKGRPASMIYHLSNQMKAGKNPRIFKMGEQKRDHVYVKDCVKATMLAIEGKPGVYNVGTGIATSFNELIKVFNEVLGTSYEPEYFDMPYDPKTYQANTQADTKKAEKYLKFKSEWPLKDGLRDYMGWLDEQAN